MHFAFEARDDGGELLVRVTPRASRSEVAGFVELPQGRRVLAARVAAPPVDGEANSVLVQLLARELGLRKSDVRIISGDGARVKRVHLRGKPEAICAKLEVLAGR